MFILCSLLCRFDVFFCLWNRVLSSCLAPDFSPSPLYELSPYRRGGCSSIARQSKEQRKEQQEETGLCPVFPLALRGYY